MGRWCPIRGLPSGAEDRGSWLAQEASKLTPKNIPPLSLRKSDGDPHASGRRMAASCPGPRQWLSCGASEQQSLAGSGPRFLPEALLQVRLRSPGTHGRQCWDGGRVPEEGLLCTPGGGLLLCPQQLQPPLAPDPGLLIAWLAAHAASLPLALPGCECPTAAVEECGPQPPPSTEEPPPPSQKPWLG